MTLDLALPWLDKPIAQSNDRFFYSWNLPLYSSTKRTKCIGFDLSLSLSLSLAADWGIQERGVGCLIRPNGSTLIHKERCFFCLWHSNQMQRHMHMKLYSLNLLLWKISQRAVTILKMRSCDSSLNSNLISGPSEFSTLPLRRRQRKTSHDRTSTNVPMVPTSTSHLFNDTTRIRLTSRPSLQVTAGHNFGNFYH